MKRGKYVNGNLTGVRMVEGERIELKVARITLNGEPIEEGAPPIYTERKDGVLPQYDIRTDRWEVALDAMDTVAKSNLAKREQRLKVVKGGNEGTGSGAGSGEEGAGAAANTSNTGT